MEKQRRLSFSCEGTVQTRTNDVLLEVWHIFLSNEWLIEIVSDITTVIKLLEKQLRIN